MRLKEHMVDVPCPLFISMVKVEKDEWKFSRKGGQHPGTSKRGVVLLGAVENVCQVAV